MGGGGAGSSNQGDKTRAFIPPKVERLFQMYFEAERIPQPEGLRKAGGGATFGDTRGLFGVVGTRLKKQPFSCDQATAARGRLR